MNDKKEIKEEHGTQNTSAPQIPSKQRADHNGILLNLYGERCNSWHTLTGVRFKLLGLVPTVSVVVLITLLSPNLSIDECMRTAIAIFGLLITLSLLIYEQRKAELYSDLL